MTAVKSISRQPLFSICLLHFLFYVWSKCYSHVQAAAKGQTEIEFQLEDPSSTDTAQPMLRCFLNGEESHPGEAKARNVCPDPITDFTGIHSNKEAFGKVSRETTCQLLLAQGWFIVFAPVCIVTVCTVDWFTL